MTDRYKEAIQGARDCVERNKDGGVYLPDLLRVIDSQQAEIERLSKKNEELAEILSDTIRIRYAECKAEAIKEFADRLKEHLKGNGGLYCVTTMNAKIDNLVKEMAGEDK